MNNSQVNKDDLKLINRLEFNVGVGRAGRAGSFVNQDGG
jgi:hypothetical protein